MRFSKILFFIPILFGIFFILVPYNENITDFTITDVTPIFFIFLLGIALFSLIVKKIIKDNAKSFLISTLVTVVFFIYVPIHSSLFYTPPEILVQDAHDVIMMQESERLGHIILLPSMLIALSATLFFLIKSKKNFENVLKISFVIALSLVFFNITEMAYSSAQSSLIADNSVETFSIDQDNLRDVYHIILDSHASTAVLKQYFNYDNSDFENFLKERGFFIPEFSFSNYYMSQYSIPSILNMDYVHSDVMSEEEQNILFSETLAENSAVKNFERNGYEIITITNEYNLNPSKDSTKLCAGDVRSLRLLVFYLDITPFKIFKSMIFSALDRTSNSEQVNVSTQPLVENRICAFNELHELPNTRKNFSHPMFVQAHLFVPHAPFIFDSKGDIVNFRALSYEQLPHAYLEQLQYTDIKIQEIVEKLLDSEPKPIIIIQSDHGVRFQLDEKDEQPLKHSFLNFEAFYFPGVELDKDEYPVITPVNSFRILFNNYFGTDYELLENHAFMEEDGKFSDVTDFVISNRIFEKDQ